MLALLRSSGVRERADLPPASPPPANSLCVRSSFAAHQTDILALLVTLISRLPLLILPIHATGEGRSLSAWEENTLEIL
eukprot:1184060-Prorocentrum_minimum.AAC.4